MLEISKKKLLSIIAESHLQDVEEMADWKKMKGIVKNYEKILDDEKNLVGWNIKGTPILFTCGNEIGEFMETHQKLIEQLKEKFGDSLKWEQGNLPGCQPRRKMSVKDFPTEPGGRVRSKKIVTSYTGPETNMGAKERILRKLNHLIVEKLENPEVTKHLEMVSIPTIKGRERTHIDRYSEINNNRITYKTHTFNSYESSQDFLRAVMSRIRGNVPENMETYYLARQFNKIYRNWEETKKNNKRYYGLTDIYQLKKYGLEEKNLDVTVAMFFEIKGELFGNTYTWYIKLKTEHGKKLKEDGALAKLTPDRELIISKSVQFEEGTQFTDQYTVLDNLPIVQGLIEGLDDLVGKIMEINPKEALKLANIKRKDVQKVDENYINNLIKTTILELNTPGETKVTKHDKGFDNPKFGCVLKQGFLGYDLNHDGVVEMFTQALAQVGESKQYFPNGIMKWIGSNTHAQSPGTTTTGKYYCVGNKLIDSFLKNPGFVEYKNNNPFVKKGLKTVIPVFVKDPPNGNFIKKLQQALINKGYLRIKSPTGNYGRMTQSAVFLATKSINTGQESNQGDGITQEMYNMIVNTK